MDITWGSEAAHRFITNVGLVTTNGKYGYNIMACEWTFHLSYRPGLLGVAINPRHATHEHIRETKEFGMCIASVRQSMLSSIAGKDSAKHYNKIKVAEAMGYSFSKAKNIDALLPAGSAAVFECKLFSEVALGDHTLFVGEVLDAQVNAEEKPLSYHSGKYWSMTTPLEKPAPEMREKIKELFEKFRK